MPSRCATAAASTRPFTPSLARMFDTCTLADLGHALPPQEARLADRDRPRQSAEMGTEAIDAE